jgi:hypothetical protein
MTEHEWQVCADPNKMLSFLRGKGSNRKFRLFTVACCRRIWHLLTDERSREAVQIGERYADGLVCEPDRLAAAEAAKHVDIDGTNDAADAAYLAAEINSPRNHPDAEWGIASDTMSSAAYADPKFVKARTTDFGLRYYPLASIQEAHCQLLRDIFGNPFRTVAVERSWLTSEVVTLAETIYDRRTFDRMTELANALERAGCTDAVILDHCRNTKEHVRGCWVVDLILGRHDRTWQQSSLIRRVRNRLLRLVGQGNELQQRQRPRSLSHKSACF